MALIRHLERDKSSQTIFRDIVPVCRELSIQVLAEGIESCEELSVLREYGVELFQGYYFARPAFRLLASMASEAIVAVADADVRVADK